MTFCSPSDMIQPKRHYPAEATVSSASDGIQPRLTNPRFRPPLTAYNLINLARGVDKSKVRPPLTAYNLINLARGVGKSKV